MKIIDMEAHFMVIEYQNYLLEKNASRGAPAGLEDLQSPIFDLGSRRIKIMDDAGIDMQVLMLSLPHIQFLEPAEGVTWAKFINDKLAEAVNKYPNRFIGLACVAPQSPDEAAKELERAVTKLGLRGLCLQSHARNEYLDDKKYRPIFATAEKLKAPIYIHPGIPSKAIFKPYADYGEPMIHYAFGADVSLHSLRLILSGLFDEFPGLQIILGHMGEGLPYWLSRLDTVWTRGYKPTINKRPSEYIKKNFNINTSGFFFQPALICAMLAMGADRISFAVDYPMADNGEALQFMKEAPICDEDKEKIFYKNAQRLFRLKND